MPSSQDTEITLGTGKMLVIFFALAALCAVFFGMGFKLGKSSATTVAASETPVPAAAPASAPQAAKPEASRSQSSPDFAYYQRPEDGDKTVQPASATTADSSAGKVVTPVSVNPTAATPADPTLAPAAGYYVQVAAVSKQEDANALVDALKRKQYPAFVAPGSDNLFHVQVGPFADVKNAEEMRVRLVNDGYNPILKK
jgi:DedD protein